MGLELVSKKSWKSHLQHTCIPASARNWIWRLFFIAPPLAVFLMSFPFTIMRVQGASMAPFFNINSAPDLPPTAPDIILVKKIKGIKALSNLTGYRLDRLRLERGQIVVFYAPHDPTKLAVKRVIGIPGDRIKPLPGYPGGDDPVIIPYNHVWVEGDANSRERSMDSNYFGPISQNMVFGLVIAVLTPWTSPVAVNWDEHDYPAKTSGRLEKDVVQQAKLDPDEEASQKDNPFADGRAAIELAMMRKNRDQLVTMMRDRSKFNRLKGIYERAQTELRRGNKESREVASELVEELQVLFESVGLNKDGSPIPPAMGSLGQGGENEQQDLERQKRLKVYLARQHQHSNEGIES
ncbi:signal peptidase I [Cladophialophora bantiana CBS 173.52]|uniref:Mitochondrial inner membrane protease subunit 2 n=1 Tax=Cladophialophora bantiana (strain ATCC 10958 / CBS 173.52 / CDC B-1940 / NIH 8579) TaxID=1442370 RepID=A0A0D2EAQ4_CLAB1|nr:signal peptidase I [Cladophialophora bantiana CBS 173.52]KIW87226.1 signal peptidase I [Cladophialophora bantiana CBS 173.52]